MEYANFYRNKTILVTGGVGSIGSELVKKILHYHPSSVRVFDNNETALFELENELKSPAVRILIGDVRDKDRLFTACDGVDIIFHASALKHVPICEFNPFDAVKTNVLGTQNLIEAALVHNVGTVINISTDKAVNPTNVMGATKLLGERLIISAANYAGKRRTTFSNVRFGNVLHSRGSVIPLFIKQIRNGGPVTITDTGMTRFFMDIPQAVNLILAAGRIARGREIFILKMPAFRIADLAEILVEIHAPRFGYKAEEIPVQIIGKRDGEKLDEELMTGDEAEHAYENDAMYLIAPQSYPYDDSLRYPVPKGFKRTKVKAFSSRSTRLLNKEEIRKIFKQ